MSEYVIGCLTGGAVGVALSVIVFCFDMSRGRR